MSVRIRLAVGVLLCFSGEAVELCKEFRSTVAYGLDQAAIEVSVGTGKSNQPLGKVAPPAENAGRQSSEREIRSFDLALRSYSLEPDGAIRISGMDARGNSVTAIAPAGFCAAMSPWGRHIATVHQSLSSYLNPELVRRVQRVNLGIVGVPFIERTGEVVLQPLLQVRLPESVVRGESVSRPVAFAVVPSANAAAAIPIQSGEVRAPFRTQADNAPVGVRAADIVNPTTGNRFGLGDIRTTKEPVMESGRLFLFILAVMGTFMFVSFTTLILALFRNKEWKVAALAADENQKASLSRSLALLGAPILLGGYLGLTIAGIAAVLEDRAFPEMGQYLLAGGSLFLPYIVNQGRVALQRGVGAGAVGVRDQNAGE